MLRGASNIIKIANVIITIAVSGKWVMTTFKSINFVLGFFVGFTQELKIIYKAAEIIISQRIVFTSKG